MKAARSLRFKLLTGGILAVLVPLVIVAAFVYFEFTSTMGDQARDECQAVAVSLAGMVNVGMTEQLNIVKGIVNDITDLAQDSVRGNAEVSKVVARKLEAEGKLVLAGRGGEELVV